MENETITPVIEEPAVPQVPMEPEKKNNLFKILVIFLGILIVLGLFANAYLMFSKKETVTKTPDSSVIATPTLDPIADWKTYTNEIIGFSLSYPQEYTITGEDQAGNVTFISPTKNKDALVFSIGVAGEFNGKPADYLKDIEDYLKEAGISSSVDSIKEIKVNGLDAIYVKYSHEGGGEAYYLLKDHKRILIDKNPIITSKQYEFDQILSTFRFD